MADAENQVYHSSKPSGAPPLPFPPSKSQINGATRLAYRPNPGKPSRRGRRRSLCCSCCLFFVSLLVGLVILAAVAVGVFYAVYRPHRPLFSVSALRLAALNVSSSGQLSSRLDLNVTARNPNKKLAYLYDPVSFSVLSGGADLGDGTFAAFVGDFGGSTLLSASASSSGQQLDTAAASGLRKGSSAGLPVEIEMETKAGVKVGALKTKKIGIKVRCQGIDVPVPKGKAAGAASSASDCKVKLRIKIWKWTL